MTPAWLWVEQAVLVAHGRTLGATGIAVYVGLASYANRERQAWPGQRGLAQRLGISQATVGRAIAKLEALGLIIVERHQAAAGNRATNHYVLVRKGGAETAAQAPLEPRGGEPLETQGEPLGMQGASVAVQGEPLGAQGGEPLGKRNKKQQEKTKQEKETPRRSRLPTNFPLTDALRTYCTSKGCRDPDRIHEAFTTYYRGAGKPQLDWPATFRTWVLGAHGGPAWKACGCQPVPGSRPPSTLEAARSLADRWRREGKIA